MVANFSQKRAIVALPLSLVFMMPDGEACTCQMEAAEVSLGRILSLCADRSRAFEEEVSGERSLEVDKYPYSYNKPGHSKKSIPGLTPCDGLENAGRYSNYSQRYAEGPCPSSSRKETDPRSKI